MATQFSTLPIVDLSPLQVPSPSTVQLECLSQRLYDVFSTTGFAYLVNAPISFSHQHVFGIARDFFRMSDTEKMSLAKCSFVKTNANTYRGYFPPQPGQQDNLKEGFEIGPVENRTQTSRKRQKFNMSEPNVWPKETEFPNGKSRLQQLHAELQALSVQMLSLLSISLGKPADFFSAYLQHSISTLRLLHYPPQSMAETESKGEVKLCCTPHTDSGILTLLHQDQTGGLEVLNAAGEWIPAPYIPGSIVVNIGDLLSQVSGGRLVATMHRVRASGRGVGKAEEDDGIGRLSIPFFFEPGEDCLVRSVDGGDQGVLYGDHVRRKMDTWVEFQDQPSTELPVSNTVAVEAY